MKLTSYDVFLHKCSDWKTRITKSVSVEADMIPISKEEHRPKLLWIKTRLKPFHRSPEKVLSFRFCKRGECV